MVWSWLILACGASAQSIPSGWYKGNTHTHTLWSDGDEPPELTTRWYKDHGYNFLVLSDHNLLATSEKWYPVQPGGRLSSQKIAQLKGVFGDDAVHLRRGPGGLEMVLVTLAELRRRFEAKNFLLITGEEITDHAGQTPVHVNGVNLSSVIPPQGGNSVAEVAERDLAAVVAQGRQSGQSVLGHLNHPNFGWAFGPDDLAKIHSENFFEVYSGNPDAHNRGNAQHPSSETMWDHALMYRLREMKLPPLFGIGCDDAHNYQTYGLGKLNPGRGWVVVRCKKLTANAIVDAMRAGDFYASSGVVLKDLRVTRSDYRLQISPAAGVQYTTQFIGAHKGQAPKVLAEVKGLSADYHFQGDEVYVRARVTSTRPCPNPPEAGDFESAWLQPVVP